jgi:hypothetical protein
VKVAPAGAGGVTLHELEKLLRRLEVGYWLVEATERLGPRWGFLVRSQRKPTEADVASRMMSLGRVIELSGQTVEVARLGLSILRVRRDATKQSDQDGVARYSIEGAEID